MSRKILFISSFNPDNIKTSGVNKKLWLEIETFETFGYSVEYLVMKPSGVSLNFNGIQKNICEWKGTYHRTFISVYSYLRNNVGDWDLLYIRYEHFSFEMISFLKTFKSKNNGMILSELPTYIKHPYKSDSLKHKISFYIKRFLNIIVPKPIDFMVTFSDDKFIFGLPTIRIENFTDVLKLPQKKNVQNHGNSVNFLVLAQLSLAHGVDLVLKGIYEYYNSGSRDVEVFVNIVGDGPILEELVELSNSLHLNKYVCFHGPLGGDELDKIFDASDIGVGALAIFRKSKSKLSELKIREFTARGLPFVYNGIEPQLENQFFALKVPFEDTPLDIQNAVDFYSEVIKRENYLDEMRKFAISEFSSTKQLKKVRDEIEQYFNK